MQEYIDDPSLLRNKKITQESNIVKIDEEKFEFETVDEAKKAWSDLTSAKVAWGMTTRGEAQSRENFNFGGNSGTSTGWTQHN